MSSRLRANLIKYGCCAVFVGLMAWGYVALRDNFSTETLMEQYRILCDAFTVPGVILVLSGAMIAIANEGALDGLGYVLSYAFNALIPGGRFKHEKYFDYVERKRNKKVKGYGFLFISGAVSLAVSLVFMILFYRLYNA